MGEEGGFTSHAGVFLPSELLLHRCLPKTDDNDKTHKNEVNTPYLDIRFNAFF